MGGKQERQCEWHCRVIQETPSMSVYHGGVSIESLCIGSSFRPGHTMPWLLGVGPRHVRFAGCTAAAIDGSVFDVSAWSPRDATPKTVWLMTLGRLLASCLVYADRAHRCTSPPLESACLAVFCLQRCRYSPDPSDTLSGFSVNDQADDVTHERQGLCC